MPAGNLGFIESMSNELSALAKIDGLVVLAYLFDMAAQEARVLAATAAHEERQSNNRKELSE